MAEYARAELEEMVKRWLQVNKDAEEAGDWSILADMYTEDATYGWNYGPDTDFMAVGRDEIREVAVGLEMGGLNGWVYPYQQVLIDEKAGQVVGFWRQIATTERPDGSRYEVAGIGGSWFGYGGDHKWAWQRDWFDFGNAGAVFMEMIVDGTLTDAMTQRMKRGVGNGQPGHYPRGESPAPIWPVDEVN